MYKKKYGKVTVNAWLNMEMEQSRPMVMILFGFLMMAAGIIVRFAVGSPYIMIHALDIADILPPVWLLSLLWTLAFLTIGCAAGFVLGFRAGGCEVDKYKGSMLFVILAVLELCWYPTLFGAGLLFLSILESILILCFAVGVTVCYYRVSKFAGVLFLLHDIWLIYMLILNFAVFFKG